MPLKSSRLSLSPQNSPKAASCPGSAPRSHRRHRACSRRTATHAPPPIAHARSVRPSLSPLDLPARRAAAAARRCLRAASLRPAQPRAPSLLHRFRLALLRRGLACRAHVGRGGARARARLLGGLRCGAARGEELGVVGQAVLERALAPPAVVERVCELLARGGALESAPAGGLVRVRVGVRVGVRVRDRVSLARVRINLG